MDFALKGWLWIVMGVLMIGMGGVFSTWGWDNINKKARKHKLAFSLAREWGTNQRHLQHKPLFFKPEDANVGEKHYTYPRFQTVVLQSLCASDLIMDDELLHLSMKYVQLADTCNHYFASFDDYCGKSLTKSERADKYKEVNTKFSPLMEFKECHQTLLRILKERYSKEFKEAFTFVEKADKS